MNLHFNVHIVKTNLLQNITSMTIFIRSMLGTDAPLVPTLITTGEMLYHKKFLVTRIMFQILQHIQHTNS